MASSDIQAVFFLLVNSVCLARNSSSSVFVEELLSNLGTSEKPLFPIVAKGNLWIFHPSRIDTQEFDSFFLRHNPARGRPSGKWTVPR